MKPASGASTDALAGIVTVKCVGTKCCEWRQPRPCGLAAPLSSHHQPSTPTTRHRVPGSSAHSVHHSRSLTQEHKNLLIGHRAANHPIQDVMRDIMRIRKAFGRSRMSFRAISFA